MISLVSTETGLYDLTSTRTVRAATVIDAVNLRLVKASLRVGDGVNDLDGAGGTFELIIIIGSQIAQPSPQPFAFGTNARALVTTSNLIIPAGDTLELRIRSPNGADLSVRVVADVFDVGGLSVAQAGYVDLLPTIQDGVEADWNLDRTTDAGAWRIGTLKRGTATPLLTKLLKDQFGNPISDAATPVAGMIEAP